MTRSRPARLHLCALEARDNPSGGLFDTTFNGTGQEQFARSVLNRVTALAVQPDGKIVAAGYGIDSHGSSFMSVARLNPDGGLDTTFNGTGSASLSTYSGGKWWAVALQPDGKIVVGGFGNVARNMGTGYVVARYNPNGTLDTTFGTPGKRGASGVWAYDPSGGNEQLRDLGVVTNGSNQVTGIVLGGTGYGPAGWAFAAMKLTPAGALDPTFGSGGSTLLEINGLSSIYGGMAVTPAGGMVMVGSGSPGNYGAVAVLTPAGQLDAGFNGTGYRLDHAAGAVNGTSFDDVAVQPLAAGGYRYVVSGLAGMGNPNGGNEIVTAYTSAGQLDTTFATGGLYVSPALGEFTHLAVAPDGSIFAAGYAAVPPDGEAVVAHLFADGTADTSFGPTGDGLSAFNTGPDITGLAVDGSGRPLIGGSNQQGWLVRLTAN
jgi:uncharacterized delta-60 repeat protein